MNSQSETKMQRPMCANAVFAAHETNELRLAVGCASRNTCPLRVDAGVNLGRRKAVLFPTFVNLVRTRIVYAPYLIIRRIPMGSAFKDPVLSL